MESNDKYRERWIADIEKFLDIEEPLRMYDKSFGNLITVYNSNILLSDDDKLEDWLDDMSKYVDIEAIKKQGKYQYYLKLAYRMGYKPYKNDCINGKQEWRKLNDLEKDQLAIHAAIIEKVYKAGYTPEYLSKIKTTIDHCSSPKYYVKNCYATNDLGRSPDMEGINIDDVGIYDQAVRKACEILADKGYITYWSSANEEDIRSRYGNVVKDKNVAYILIDPKNLTDELKERLFLDGKNRFWGVARAYAEKENPKDEVGKYYGIWAEITSENMTCYELSDKLVEKAVALPFLVDKHEIMRQQKQNNDPHKR